MRSELIEKAVALGAKLQHVFVGTTNAEGLPHLAAAEGISVASEGRVAVDAWFCPGTVKNLETNRKISLVVYDAVGDKGYQLLGEVEEIKELAFADGNAPEDEGSDMVPNVERQLLVSVDKVVRFSHAPHSDVEES